MRGCVGIRGCIVLPLQNHPGCSSPRCQPLLLRAISIPRRSCPHDWPQWSTAGIEKGVKA